MVLTKLVKFPIKIFQKVEVYIFIRADSSIRYTIYCVQEDTLQTERVQALTSFERRSHGNI
jgi:predicted ATPase